MSVVVAHGVYEAVQFDGPGTDQLDVEVVRRPHRRHKHLGKAVAPGGHQTLARRQTEGGKKYAAISYQLGKNPVKLDETRLRHVEIR